MKQSEIRYILFDLGGVILNLDKARCFDAFANLGIDLSDVGLGFYGQKGLFGELELGTVSGNDFFNRFRKLYHTNATNQEISDAWNNFLVDIPAKRLDWLIQLRKRFNLYLLSNTSKIHFDFWQTMFRYSPDKTGAEYFFDGVYCSFATHLAKPDKRAFEYVMKREGMEPDKTLFFDDSRANIDAAASMGFNTIWMKEGEELSDFNIDNLI